MLGIMTAAALAAGLQGGGAVEHWRFALDVRGEGETERVELPFEVDLDTTTGRATIRNGEERIAVPEAHRDAAAFTLDFPHYDSRLELHRVESDTAFETFEGTWTKTRGAGATSVVPVRAVLGPTHRFEPVEGLSVGADAVAGRWRVAFSSSDVPAVGVFESDGSTGVTGTFLTDTGDYRYLAGDVSRRTCASRASTARTPSGSRPTRRVPASSPAASSAAAPGGRRAGARCATTTRHSPTRRHDFGLREVSLVEHLAFPDADGAWRPLWNVDRPLVVELFGSWCPNCHDAAVLLEELHREHGESVDVVGLAFELTGDFARDAEQVRRFREARGVTYPLLIGGTADKGRAAQALGITDTVLAFPTTIVLDRNGHVVRVYSGFSGPATGAAYVRVREILEDAVRRRSPCRARVSADSSSRT
ncbi:MAG: TlpA disulfide reductase family protein [Planctomycetota bacterium]